MKRLSAGTKGRQKRPEMLLVRGQRGDVLLMLAVVLTVMLPALAYLMANYADLSAKTINYYKALRTRQQIATIRNLLIDDAVQNGGTMMPPDGESPPGAVIENAFPAPVKDAWGGDITYCKYDAPPVTNLAARIISGGKNKLVDTVCSDTGAVGDDLVENIFIGDLKEVVSMGSTGSEPTTKAVSMIDAKGSNSSYAIYDEQQLIAWGLNTSGQAGINLNSYNPNRPEYATVGTTGDFLTNITTISAGGSHVLAVKSDKTVWAWGAGANGRLGDGFATNRLIPVQVKVTQTPITYLKNVSDISAGGSHSMALDLDRNVWTWGLNTNGQLGDGTSDTTAHSYAIQVPDFSGVTAISAGGSHSMALKSESDGTVSVWAWGLNSSGQLGNSSTSNAAVPEQVLNFSGITAISAGATHSMALKSDGTVWTWGAGANGRLGNGFTVNSTFPVQVVGLSGINIVAISAGGSHSMALDSDGNVWAWGLNTNGQLGDGLTTQRTSPFQVPGLSNVSVISAGAEHSLALVRDIATSRYIIYSWGRNNYGQLGDGTNYNSSSPVKVQLPVMEMF